MPKKLSDVVKAHNNFIELKTFELSIELHECFKIEVPNMFIKI
jgi:hypothetical protein